MEDPKATSVRQRLLNLAHEKGDDYNQVLTRYAGLRFIARLAASSYANAFLLKGATMFLVWHGSLHRPTKDIDLLGFIEPNPEVLLEIVRHICQHSIDPDGIVFDPESAAVHAIRSETSYGGLRCVIRARLGSTKLSVQIDVGFGDAVTPEPSVIDIPRLLDDEKPQTMRAYTPETVIAEKYEALVRLGLANSRMKDYFDLDILLADPSLNHEMITEAIRSTFTRRSTLIPTAPPLGLTGAFWNDAMVMSRWRAFLTKNRLADEALESVCYRIRERLLPENLPTGSDRTENQCNGDLKAPSGEFH
jgi:Nucleotidyl transferase AbiEii toxin, Type IV TA system